VVGTLAFHRRGIGVGLAEEEVRLAPVEVALHFPVLAPRLGDPVAPGGVGADELIVVGVWQVIEVSSGRSRCSVRVEVRLFLCIFLKEILQMLLHSEAGRDRLQGSIRLDLGGIEVELFAPHKAGFYALLHDLLEEAAEDSKPVAIPDLGEAGVVGQGLVEVVSQIPADAKAVGHNSHQLPLASQSLEEEDKLEFEEDYRVHARATSGGVAIDDQFPHKREIERPLQVSVEVLLRDEFFEREVREWSKVTLLNAHHGRRYLLLGRVEGSQC
jgi:hypothetical protein